MLMNKEIEMTFERATKNTYRFNEGAAENIAIGTLYVQKAVFEGKQPAKIKVSIEWE